jgi:hypothetical protein
VSCDIRNRGNQFGRPDRLGLVPLEAWRKRSNTWGMNSGAISCPVSTTFTSILDAYDRHVDSSTVGRELDRVLQEVLNHLLQSPLTIAVAPGAGENRRSICLFAAIGLTTSRAVCVTAIRSTGCGAIAAYRR